MTQSSKGRPTWCIGIYLLLIFTTVSGDVVPCKTSDDCESLVDPKSECGEGFCSNPFASGCFQRLMPEEEGPDDLIGQHKKRVCNSDDSAAAIQQGVCLVPEFDYMEIRVFSHNWESAIFESWILQILMSELAGLPATVESGSSEGHLNFYDPINTYQYGTTDDRKSMEVAENLTDCRLASKEPGEGYESCAHVVTEVWDGVTAWEMTIQGIAEPPQALGVIGQEGWFIPRFTAERDPSLLSYLGIRGEQNRQKLADTFLRPTTWKAYCDEVSTNQCQTPDSVAERAPQDEEESGRMFVAGLYTGNFRATYKNDCDLNPDNCTGHIADYPCGWSSNVLQQAYHLGIAVEGDGEEPMSKGYSYSQLLEIWEAANATKSNVLMYWWYPDNLFQKFSDTDAEFMKVALPTPTQACVESRLSTVERCNEDYDLSTSDPVGACDDAPNIIQKVISSAVVREHFSKPEATRSPGYPLVDSFSLSGLQLAEIMDYWKKYGNRRTAVCEWMVDNRDWAMAFVPPGYPRTIQSGRDTASYTLEYVAYTLCGLATAAVLVATFMVYKKRRTKVIEYAQIDFLYSLLVGLLIIAVGSVVNVRSTSDASCMVTVWLINIGYTLEFIPLLVKVSALNKMMRASANFRRVVIRRWALFGAVVLITGLVMVYLTVWTILDPSKQQQEYILTEDVTSGNETIVFVASFCSSSKDVWVIISNVWFFVMLICATVLAIQTRKMRGGFNESRTLGLMIYTHTMFVTLRFIFSIGLGGTLHPSLVGPILSIIYSLDIVATIMIYFIPKFLQQNPNPPASISTGFSPARGVGFDTTGSLGLDPSSVIGASDVFTLDTIEESAVLGGTGASQSRHEDDRCRSCGQEIRHRRPPTSEANNVPIIRASVQSISSGSPNETPSAVDPVCLDKNSETGDGSSTEKDSHHLEEGILQQDEKDIVEVLSETSTHCG